MVSKGFIYKICVKDGSMDKIYIGSTRNVKSRKQRHKQFSNNPRGRQPILYDQIKECGGWDNWEFVILEEAEFENKNAMKNRERHYIEELKPCLNSYIPTRTRNEWNEEHREHVLNRMKDWRNKNIEMVREKDKIRTDANKESKRLYDKQKFPCDVCGKEMTRSWLKHHNKTKHSS